MNCDLYSETDCVQSNDCFLCVDRKDNSKCISKSSKEVNKCVLANPYNVYEYNYQGSAKSTDDYTKKLSEKAMFYSVSKKGNFMDYIRDFINSILSDKLYDPSNDSLRGLGIILIIVG